MCLLCVVATSGRKGCVLSSFSVCVCFFCLFVFFFVTFPRRKGYFILHVGGVMDSSSAGQGLTYVSILEAYISFEGGYKGLAVSKNHFLLLYISQLYF